MKTTEDFIKKAREIHGDKYDYSKVKYVKSSVKVCIICPKHGEFWMTPNNHLKGKGCKECYKERRKIIKKYSTEEFIKKAKEIHGDKYDYSKVNYKNIKTPVCIICQEHGEFWQIPYSHLNGKGCKKCAVEKVTNKQRLTTEDFIKKAREIHGDKYDYSKVKYVNAKTKVCIIYPEHGEFWQTPYNHLKQRNIINSKFKYQTFDNFKNEIIKKYGDIYDLSLAEQDFRNSESLITVGYLGKYFKIKARKLLNGNNNKPILKERVYCLEDFIKKAREIHGDKYDYSKVKYVNAKTKVCIICPEHGEFWQTPNIHLMGYGCTKCSKDKKRSAIERMISNELMKRNINFIEEYSPTFLNEKFSHQRLDFYLPDYNIAIECQGGQHFKDSKNYGLCEKSIKRDIKKYYKCKKNNINVLYFLERHIKISEIIDNRKYENIYSKENTFRNINYLLENIQ